MQKILEAIRSLQDVDRIALLQLLATRLPEVSISVAKNDQLRVLESLAASAVQTIFGLRRSVRSGKFVWSSSPPDFRRMSLRGDEFDPDRLLVGLARNLCEMLSIEYATAGFSRVAQECRDWPVLLGSRALSRKGARDIDSAARARVLLERLPLAERSPVRFDARFRPINRSTPRNLAVVWHLNEMLAYWDADASERVAIATGLELDLQRSNTYALHCSIDPHVDYYDLKPYWSRWHRLVERLPRLDPNSVDMWFEAMWVKILDEYQGHPEHERGSLEFLWYPQLSVLPDLSAIGRKGGDAAEKEKREEEKQKIRRLDPQRVEKEKAIDGMDFERRAERGAVKSIRKALLAAMRTLIGRQGAQGAGSVDGRRPKRGPTPTGGRTRRPVRSPKKRL